MALGELNTSENRRRALRREIKVAAAALDKGYTKEVDFQIFRHATDLPEYEQADTPSCFVETNSEVGTAPILEDALGREKRVGAPRCIPRGIMEVREIRGLRDLEAGKYSIMEPGTHAPVIQAEKINLAIVSCIPRSHDDRRLGCGGGYYDHYLGRTRVVGAVVCREWVMRADMPVEPYDQTMDMVVSEKGVRRPVGQ